MIVALAMAAHSKATFKVLAPRKKNAVMAAIPMKERNRESVSSERILDIGYVVSVRYSVIRSALG
jgi:hypothetical protein